MLAYRRIVSFGIVPNISSHVFEAGSPQNLRNSM